MATSEILLLQPVDNLGAEGDQVTVKAGYARNFLLPRKIAVPVTKSNRKQIESLKKAREARERKELDVAKELASKLEGLHIAIAVKTGDGGKMFGAVTAADLMAKINESGIELDRKKVHFYTPIKTLGQNSTKIKLHADVVVDLNFDVVSEPPIVEAEEE